MLSVIVILVTMLIVLGHVRSSLVIQNQNFSQTLGTLGAQTALLLSSSLSSSLTHSFLAKRWRGTIQVDSLDDTEGPLAIGLARGDATVAEIAAAFTEANTAGPTDTSQTLTEDEVWTIVQNSVVYLEQGNFEQETGTGKTNWHARWDISLKKGFPFNESQGWVIFIINLDSGALTTGSAAKGHSQVWGVWLNA